MHVYCTDYFCRRHKEPCHVMWLCDPNIIELVYKPIIS